MTARQRLLERVVVRELLTDQLRKVTPYDGAIRRPNLYAEDPAERQETLEETDRLRGQRRSLGSLERLGEHRILAHGQPDDLRVQAHVGIQFVAGEVVDRVKPSAAETTATTTNVAKENCRITFPVPTFTPASSE